VERLSVQNIQRKKEWKLSGPALERLLDWLDEGKHSGGQSYLDLRQRLVAYFDRKNCRWPDDLADETLNRVARRLEEEGEIVSETAARYCYIVARFVFHEYLRRSNDEVSLDAVSSEAGASDPAVSGSDDEEKHREHLLDCLDRCTEKLDPAQRDLIIRYYHGEQRIKIENRNALARQLGITINALSIRACRIRDKLEACVSACAAGMKRFSRSV
jgi:DNA-directed RNA polymerase specialized sigma24 family protein